MVNMKRSAKLGKYEYRGLVYGKTIIVPFRTESMDRIELGPHHLEVYFRGRPVKGLGVLEVPENILERVSIHKGEVPVIKLPYGIEIVGDKAKYNSWINSYYIPTELQDVLFL